MSDYRKLNVETIGENHPLYSPIYSTSKTDILHIDGCVLPSPIMNLLEPIKCMEIRDDDVWICSFPRSGTTWTQETVWCILNVEQFENNKTDIRSRSPYLEFSGILPNPDLSLPNSVTKIENMTTRRIVKTHLPYQFMPNQLRNNSTSAKIVYIARDPRDVCISYFFTFVNNKKIVALEEFYDIFMKGTVKYGPYWNNVNSFLKHRNNPNILFITYEDMKKDLKSEIEKIAEFLNKQLTREQIDKLATHLDFETMKDKSHTNPFSGKELEKKNLGECFREGKTAQWKQHMDTEVIDRFDSWIKKNQLNL